MKQQGSRLLLSAQCVCLSYFSDSTSLSCNAHEIFSENSRSLGKVMSYPVVSREIPSPMASFSSFRPIFKQSIFFRKGKKNY